MSILTKYLERRIMKSLSRKIKLGYKTTGLCLWLGNSHMMELRVTSFVISKVFTISTRLKKRWLFTIGGTIGCHLAGFYFSSVQSLGHVLLFATPWTAARQASLSISQRLLKLTSIESMMPSNHLILCHTLLLLPSIFPSIRVFSNEKSFLHNNW